MHRPRRVVAVVGTDTGVGKTWVCTRIVAAGLAAGSSVAVRKPVQSYGPADAGRTDADLLAAAAGVDPTEVCPRGRWYPLAMAPPMAAEALGRPAIALADLAVTWDPRTDLALVETVGGVRSPVAHDGDSLALVDLVEPDLVLVVTDAALGTLNATTLTLAAVAPRPTLVFVNRLDRSNDLHRRNLAWLERNVAAATDVVTAVDEVTARLL